uniref:Uncharacterized protein AlNc14C138G7166 n=1 Tax=Albugo laibachii Nc14 TaxID=890382 RepID=F0WKX6_9STRA|nr:conserved hypothetical protein [Albugo laibachii Nc14]CCA24785.1 conserved hypothetical protein [Albugo laibachii Nc14]|eukprot:CCA24785.1 conserved hypothetical protein [Albugo laibachii Nc14]
MSLIDLASLLPFYMELCANYMYETLISVMEVLSWLYRQIEVQPTYRGMTSLRGLRLLRVFSFLRLERYYNAMQNLRVIFSRKSEELYIITYLTTVVVLFSSTVIFFLENEAQPNVFTTVGRCAWWSIETITSLGYGDIVPVTSLGRTFASVLALWGMVLFALPGAIIESTHPPTRVTKVACVVHATNLARNTNLTFVRGLRNMIANMTGKVDDASISTEKSEENEVNHDLVLDPFCFRQFDDAKYNGTRINYDKNEFEKRINEIYVKQNKNLVDGYAPFCKHLFVENFTDTRTNMVKITQANAHLLMSEYEARAAYELPVLVRWFPSHSVTPSMAKYLDIILYNRDQIQNENKATGTAMDQTQDEAPWGIISIKAQNVDYELPMTPITMMRNALGKEEGGSGVPLDRNKYLKSVEFWKNHANVK